MSGRRRARVLPLDCTPVREALSAGMDGEEPPARVTPQAIGEHVAGCPACARYAVAGAGLRRLAVRPAPRRPPPALVAELADRLEPVPRRRLAEWGRWRELLVRTIGRRDAALGGWRLLLVPAAAAAGALLLLGPTHAVDRPHPRVTPCTAGLAHRHRAEPPLGVRARS